MIFYLFHGKDIYGGLLKNKDNLTRHVTLSAKMRFRAAFDKSKKGSRQFSWILNISTLGSSKLGTLSLNPLLCWQCGP